MVKNLPAMQEMQVWSLDREDPLQEEIATQSSIFTWKIPSTGEPGKAKAKRDSLAFLKEAFLKNSRGFDKYLLSVCCIEGLSSGRYKEKKRHSISALQEVTV